MTNEERYRAILGNHLTPEAVEWVYDYLDRHKVHLHITRGRRSKLGDYRWPQRDRTYHEISVNGDLNPHMFLLVLLHEAAHLETHLRYGNGTVAAHGHEWQAQYAQMLHERASLFPEETRPLLARYIKRIPLIRTAGRDFEAALRRYDKGYDERNIVHLDDLQPGSLFRLKSRPEILFRAEQRRRTRWLCTDTDTHRQYTISGAAETLGIEN